MFNLVRNCTKLFTFELKQYEGTLQLYATGIFPWFVLFKVPNITHKEYWVCFHQFYSLSFLLHPTPVRFCWGKVTPSLHIPSRTCPQPYVIVLLLLHQRLSSSTSPLTFPFPFRTWHCFLVPVKNRIYQVKHIHIYIHSLSLPLYLNGWTLFPLHEANCAM